MTWLTLAKFVPWRWVGYGLAALGFLALSLRINAWHDAYKALPAAQEALQAEVECREGSACRKRVSDALARSQTVSAEVVSGYERELADLRARPVRRPVRLCVPAGSGGVQVPAPAGGTGQGAAAAGVVQPGAGPDLGPQLFDLAARADELSAQCRAIIRRDRALAGEN